MVECNKNCLGIRKYTFPLPFKTLTANKMQWKTFRPYVRIILSPPWDVNFFIVGNNVYANIRYYGEIAQLVEQKDAKTESCFTKKG